MPQASPEPTTTTTTIISTEKKKVQLELHELPYDVTLQILDLLEPGEIARYAVLNRATARVGRDATVWASAARRHLGIAPADGGPRTARMVRDLARALTCRWWVSSGLFVAGVPVHRRSGFVHVRSRGGVEVELPTDGVEEVKGTAAEAAYVFGGRHADRAVPIAVPAVSLDFALDPAGPFPVGGLRLRVLHAAEPTPASSPPSSPASVFSLSSPPPSPPAPAALDEGADDACGAPAPGEARVTVRVNDQHVHTIVCRPDGRFTALEVGVPATALVTKPALNTVALEYDRARSTAGFWLRDVALCPTIVPLPKLSPRAYVFPLAAAPPPPLHNLFELPRPCWAAADTTRSPSPSPSPSSASASSSSSSAVSLLMSPLHPSMAAAAASPSPASPRFPRGRNPRHTRRAARAAAHAHAYHAQRPARSRSPRAAAPGAQGMVAGPGPAPGDVHHERPARPQKAGKRPKHMYHKQNHRRSPRQTPSPPSASRGGRHHR